MGERDVKADVKEKSKRDKYKASAINEGDSAESFLAQVVIKSQSYCLWINLQSSGPSGDEERV